jgi:(p)ppGpp synthase/HD superfamily hydrolase
MEDPAEYFTALNELNRKVQESYERGCEDGKSFEKCRILDLLHDCIDDTPTTPGSMKDQWNQTIKIMIKKIKENA